MSQYYLWEQNYNRYFFSKLPQFSFYNIVDAYTISYRNYCKYIFNEILFLMEVNNIGLIASSQLITSIHWPCNCTFHVYAVILFCASMWSFCVHTFFQSFVYTCTAVGDPFIKRGKRRGIVGITLTDLTPPCFFSCPKPGHGFQTSYIVVCFHFQWFERRGDFTFYWYLGNCWLLLFYFFS